MRLPGKNYMTESFERIIRVETKVDTINEDITDIKDSVKGLKKTIVIMAASTSLLGNIGADSLTELIANHFDTNKPQTLNVRSFDQIDNTYTIER